MRLLFEMDKKDYDGCKPDCYPIYLCVPDVYFAFEGENAGRFSWDTTGSGILTNPDGLQGMGPDEVLSFLFD